MKNSELIALLQQYPLDIEVMSAGYEGGFQSAFNPQIVENIALDVNSEWYYGPHEQEYVDPEGKLTYPNAKHLMKVLVI